MSVVRKIDAHEWERETHEHYVEEPWCDSRLFDVEKFEGYIFDPCCGFGRIPDAARLAGYHAFAWDLVDRGYDCDIGDFFEINQSADNIVCNPPFDIFEPFARHALRLARHKVAMIWLVRRLNAARWLEDTPLARVWLMTPRPSMPPGHVVADLAKVGKRPSGGTQDFCWLVWERGYIGKPELRWLRRDA